MKKSLFYRCLPVVLVAAFFGGLIPVPAQDKAVKGPAAALQPFVDNGTLAGAVTLVANKDKVLKIGRAHV